MRSREILASIAVVGAVAAFALFNLNQLPSSSTFLKQKHGEHEASFVNWVSTYRKSYGTKEEFAYRQKVFLDNFAKIMHHNMMNTEEEGFSMELNQFADLSEKEFKMRLGLKRINSQSNDVEFTDNSDVNAPDSIDWREKGAVNPVKDQGQCGSCWAFSAVAAIEGAYALKYKKLYSLAEQQFVDCDTGADDDEHNQGCNGGDMGLAFDYANANAIEQGSDYPYHARDQKCQFDSKKGVVKVASHAYVTKNDPVALQNAVALGPVSIAIEADTFVFQFYSKGVISSKSCGTDLDHGVAVVGYGTDAKYGDYWLVRNSWGSGWGESGYARFKRDMTTSGPGICGIQMEPVYPVVA